MKRQAIDDGTWFNPEAAQCFGEETTFDGSNQISVATGSQWVHENLYRTAKGGWVLNRWSQWQGTLPSWERVSAYAAAAWLVKNLHEIPEYLASIVAGNEV